MKTLILLALISFNLQAATVTVSDEAAASFLQNYLLWAPKLPEILTINSNEIYRLHGTYIVKNAYCDFLAMASGDNYDVNFKAPINCTYDDGK